MTHRQFKDDFNFSSTEGQKSRDILPHQDDNPPSIQSRPGDGASSSNNQSSINSSDPNYPSLQKGFMVKLKFRTTIATTDWLKSNHCLIYSGGTHQFSFNKSKFLHYEPIDKETVKSASGTSIVVGKGLFKLLFDNGHLVKAYHTPQFSTNTLSVALLSRCYNVLFTCDSPSKNDECSCINTRRSDGELFSKA